MYDIRLDSLGNFDELIVTRPNSVQIEKMGAQNYWMRIEQTDRPALVLWFEVKKTPSYREE